MHDMCSAMNACMARDSRILVLLCFCVGEGLVLWLSVYHSLILLWLEFYFEAARLYNTMYMCPTVTIFLHCWRKFYSLQTYSNFANFLKKFGLVHNWPLAVLPTLHVIIYY